MPDLMLIDVDALAEAARRLGLAPAVVEGVRAMLLMRASELSGADKLRVALTMVPDDQARSMGAFQTTVATINAAIVARGRTALESLSNDEWEQMING